VRGAEWRTIARNFVSSQRGAVGSNPRARVAGCSGRDGAVTAATQLPRNYLRVTIARTSDVAVGALRVNSARPDQRSGELAGALRVNSARPTIPAARCWRQPAGARSGVLWPRRSGYRSDPVATELSSRNHREDKRRRGRSIPRQQRPPRPAQRGAGGSTPRQQRPPGQPSGGWREHSASPAPARPAQRGVNDDSNETRPWA
jgi:hypothetical protein